MHDLRRMIDDGLPDTAPASTTILYYYACFLPAYEFVPTSSVADAIAIIRHAIRGHTGARRGSQAAGESLPGWADTGTNLRYEPGDREDKQAGGVRAENAVAGTTAP